jgi:hypothetical protein
MSFVLEDYISQEFDPFLRLVQAGRVQLGPQYLDWGSSLPTGTSANLLPAPPVPFGQDRVEPEFFLDEARYRYDATLTSIWDTVTYELLERDPDFTPVWDQLLADPNPFTAWRDFRSSTDFQPTVETLGLRGRGVLKAARTVAGKAWTWLNAGKALSPQGALIWIGQEAVAAGATWLWKNRDKLDWPYRPPITHPHPHARVLGFAPDPGVDLGPFAAPAGADRWLYHATNPVPDLMMNIGGPLPLTPPAHHCGNIAGRGRTHQGHGRKDPGPARAAVHQLQRGGRDANGAYTVCALRELDAAGQAA